MPQLNLILTKQFEKDLKIYMKQKGIQTKSEAIRLALREVVLLITSNQKTDFEEWIGLALKGNTTKKPKFKSEDDLWKAG